MSNLSASVRPGSTVTPRPAGGWPAVAVVAAGTFTVITSEMMPVGLLTPIGHSLGVSEGTAGLTLTVTGLVAAVTAPLAPFVFGRADRRTVLVALMLLLAAANLLAAWAPTFTAMVAARVLVGLGMGGVWATAGALAPRLVAERSVGAATSLIFSGVAAASVIGVPLGAYVQAWSGWRESFVAIAGLSLAVAVAMAVLLPRLTTDRPARLGGTARILAEPRVLTGLFLAVLLVTGHFAAYTYVRPVLEGAAGIGAGAVGALLLVYGVLGLVGNFAAGPGAVRAPRTTLAVISVGLGAAVLALPSLGSSFAGAAVLMALWGLAYGGVSVSAQTWMMRSAPDAAESVTALFVGVFNASIALGALVGGRVMDGFGGGSVMWVAGGLAAGALLAALLGRAPSPRRAV